MTWIAAAALAALAAATGAYAQLVRALVRQQARERAQLLDRIMHLAGHTWSPPPAEQWAAPALEGNLDVDRYTAAPEQLPEEAWDTA